MGSRFSTLVIGGASAILLAVASLISIGCGEEESAASSELVCRKLPPAPPGAVVPTPTVDRFDEVAACRFLREQVKLGPRPAGSRASQILAARLLQDLPNSHYQEFDGDRLRNVLGRVRGRRTRKHLLIGAHFDTKDIPGFVGANDGAAGTAVVAELARSIKKGPKPDISVGFLFLDGEESPAGTPDSEFERHGLRGSRHAASIYGRFDTKAFLLLDFVGERGLRIPREANSDPRLWRLLRGASRKVGVAKVFPDGEAAAVIDDHVPFQREGIPAIDLIDFDYDCWHKQCDDLSQISIRSLDAVGETMVEVIRRLSRDGPIP
jgi:glutaminyl-peptide cyclotransferase